MNKLTDRQRKVLEYICESIRERGYPPTLREIGLHLGIRSTNGVNDHLRALERKGYITREDMKSRTLRPTERTLQLVGAGAAVPARGGVLASARQERSVDDEDMLEIPILGRVAAGAPVEAIEQRIDTVRIGRMLLGASKNGPGDGDLFGLRIHGDSMIEAGIHDGDYVFVRKQPHAPRGAIVIAMVGDEATCKYFYPEAKHIRLQPANPAIAPILIPKQEWRETMILGVVIGVFRRL